MRGRRASSVSGRTDYLLCVQMPNMPKPLPVGVIEAKAETEDPLKGMQQAKGYAECQRFHVQYIFATNGHRYGEFDKTQQLPAGPFPFADFQTHADLTARYAKDTGKTVKVSFAASSGRLPFSYCSIESCRCFTALRMTVSASSSESS